MIEQFIAAGEVTVGVLYCMAGLFFIKLATLSDEKSRTLFRLTIALMFLVSGLEELGDSIFTEGDGNIAIYAQATMTALQVFTGGLAVWALKRARKVMMS